MLVLWCAVAFVRNAHGADPVAEIGSIEELHQLYNDGQYQPLLRKIAKVLALKGEAARLYDRYDIFMLRGNAQLAIKAPTLAIAAFEDAQKAAGDDSQRAVAHATEILLRKSTAMKYKPGTGLPDRQKKKLKEGEKDPDAPIDIVSLESRKAAFVSLWADSMAASMGWMNAAKEARTLPGVTSAVKNVVDLRAIEIATTGKDDKSRAMLDELAGRAADLIAAEIATQKTRVDVIAAAADEEIQETVRQPDPNNITGTVDVTRRHKRGLDAKGMMQLNDVMKTCRRITPAVEELAANLPIDATRLRGIIVDNEAVIARAQTVLQTDYRGVDITPRGPGR